MKRLVIIALLCTSCFAMSTPKGRAIGVFSRVVLDSAAAADVGTRKAVARKDIGDSRVSVGETAALFTGLAALAAAVAVFFV